MVWIALKEGYYCVIRHLQLYPLRYRLDNGIGES